MKRAAMALAFVLAAFAAPAQAMTIERIVSPAGIEAWLVRESTTPLVALAYSFHGGSSQRVVAFLRLTLKASRNIHSQG